MGACLSKKNKPSTSSPPASTKSLSTPPIHQQNSHNNATAILSKPENKNNNTVQEKQQDPEVFKQHEDETQPKKEIFIIKHRKSHDEREKNSIKIAPFTVQHNDGLVSSSETESLNNSNNNNNNNNKVGVVAAVRTSSCTKEEVDAILIQCGRLSRSSSGKAASSSARKYSGSKRSFDFDHSDNNNDAISAEDEQKRANPSDNSEEYDGVARHNNRQRHRSSPKGSSNGRRRTPSREREREQRSSSRERRVSRSPGRRSSDANTANGSNNTGSGSGSSSRPGKMVTVPATVSSLVMDKSNNGSGGGDSGKRVNVKRNIASPRSMSPARVNGNGMNQNLQQQQPSLSRSNSARKTEVSPFRRNPLSEVDPNSLAYPQSNANNGGSKVQIKHKKEIEAETIQQKPKAEMRDNGKNRTSRATLEKEKGVISHTKEQQEDEIKVMSDNAIVKNVVMPSGITRSRSSRRSRDLDSINPETLTNPPPSSYTSLLLEDIHNFHQKTTAQPAVCLPACLNKACSILEAVADLNSTTSSTFSRNEYNAVPESSFVEESEVVVSDDVMEPSLHKYVTVKRGGSFSLCEDQESSGSNSFSLNSGQQQQQQHWNNCSSGDSPDCWSSRLSSKEESLMKRRECDHQHSGGIGRGRLATTSST
ncbi:uncharacterized protein At1g65710 isoform X1 [Lathyrus oleraceus]|uniref:Uncharacterized protein n=1 Tax=Pisum sativum TaxID=3888 RepID=A0A9D4YA99_PEA|nr:uncharacterized protein At1g65710 isoform X1 [Pisum sativum]KAI5434809.1 hypothetical protein KIW84_021575 [Pisum sativum]